MLMLVLPLRSWSASGVREGTEARGGRVVDGVASSSVGRPCSARAVPELKVKEIALSLLPLSKDII